MCSGGACWMGGAVRGLLETEGLRVCKSACCSPDSLLPPPLCRRSNRRCPAAGDNLMYPTPYHELSGWNIHSLACGSTTFACAATYGAEKSTITWGHTNGYRWGGAGGCQGAGTAAGAPQCSCSRAGDGAANAMLLITSYDLSGACHPLTQLHTPAPFRLSASSATAPPARRAPPTRTSAWRWRAPRRCRWPWALATPSSS